MSTFDVEEVKSLAERGNARHNAIYMAHFDETRDQRPNPNVTERMKEFIKMKYKDEKWKQGNGGPVRKDSWGGNAGNGAQLALLMSDLLTISLVHRVTLHLRDKLRWRH